MLTTSRNKLHILLTTLIGAPLLILATNAAGAPLPNGTVLSINEGVGSCVAGGTFPNCNYGAINIASGSYFDMSGKGITIISGYNGITIGAAQPATGSHTGAPDGSESPSVDNPWRFFSNTGMHFTVGNGITDPDDGTLDFSTWRVTWNGIPTINMGSGAHSGGVDGRATISCSPSPCAHGSTYSLIYYATVPSGDPSGFGGVQYTLGLEGTITVPGIATTDGGAINPGTTVGTGVSSIRVTSADMTAAGIPADVGFSNVGGFYDFVVTGVAGGVANVVIPLTTTIPENTVYRKYIGGNWTTFVADGTNKIASAASSGGLCPAVGNAAYDHLNGLVQGHDCIQLTIQDDGAYDADTANPTTTEDPGGLAAPTSDSTFVDTRTSGTSGCTLSNRPGTGISGEWLLIGGLLAGLGLYRRRQMS